MSQQVLRLVDPAQDPRLAGEDFQRHDGIEPLAIEDALGPGEIDVGRIARQDLHRRSAARDPHQGE